ncbi:MAG: sigma 54-interacting transcriptional regulator, partial [Desulfuromonadaceae bacterium]|nr:sigma 54-interacting transcriptional regulator [Desulfuromonadaceae bacterium]
MGIGKGKNKPTSPATLRSRAEKKLNTQAPEARQPKPGLETKRQLHELQVNLIELEMQNDELLRVHEDLELSQSMYAELYNFAPIAYFTFDPSGVIQNTNHRGAQLLETERREVAYRPFADFIADAKGREIFSNHLSLVIERETMLKCAITLRGNDGKLVHAQLQSIAIKKENSPVFILSSIIDNSVRRQFEEKLREAHDKLERTVAERTLELSSANMQLKQEIAERKMTEESLQSSYSEIKLLKERLRAENVYLQQEVDRQFNFGEIIGKSDPLLHVFSQIGQVAPMNATVLLLGETGTGKGVVARAIHSSSTRKGRPLIT